MKTLEKLHAVVINSNVPIVVFFNLFAYFVLVVSKSTNVIIMLKNQRVEY